MYKRSNEEILEVFHNAILDTSKFIALLNDYKQRFDWISNQTMDNADPVCDAQDCLERLGILLATLNIYHQEYMEDPIDPETGRMTRDKRLEAEETNEK
jgi:hypothetical protein